jgi:hypothetical protein
VSRWRTAGPRGAAAADGASRPPGSPPAAGADLTPGDLLTLPELADFPLEWAVLERDSATPPRLLVVPADTHPASGSADVRIAARDPAGPLVLRCAFAAWLPQAFLATGLRGARLSPPDLERAGRRIAALGSGSKAGAIGHAAEAGRAADSAFAGDPGRAGDAVRTSDAGRTTEAGRPTDPVPAGGAGPAMNAGGAADTAGGSRGASALDRETDDDPEYRDWIAETVAPAAAALHAARARWAAAGAVALVRGGEPAYRRSSPLLLRLAAAALLVVSVGTTWKAISLHQRLDLLSQPQFDMPSAEVVLDGPQRGPAAQPKLLSVPHAARNILLTFELDTELPTTGGRIKILAADGTVVWSSPPLPPRTTLFNLLLSHEQLPDGRYRVVFYPQGGDPKAEIPVHDLDVVTAP